MPLYRPRSYRNDDIHALHTLMCTYNFATLYTHREGETFVTHLPFLIDSKRGEQGTLVAHMARANPHWKAFEGAAESLVVFLGPHAYISPAWYEDTVTVPTWNYATVLAYGTPVLVDDDATLRRMVFDLIDRHEADVGRPWDVRDAAAVVETELKGIVGFEIPIRELVGKFKFNQNRSREDQQGVADALSRSPDLRERAVAEIMRENLPEGRS